MAKKKTKFKLTTATALIIAVVVLIIVIAFGTSGNTAKFFAAKQINAVINPLPICGDHVCQRASENWVSCPVDCLVCGDGFCDDPEACAITKNACIADCKGLIGDKICMANMGENAQNSQDCAVCGDGICTRDECGFTEKCAKDCFCKDSDNGINLTVKGTCTDGFGITGGGGTDACAGGSPTSPSNPNPSAAPSVREYYCNGNACTSVVKDCPTGKVCINGACTFNLTANPSSHIIK